MKKYSIKTRADKKHFINNIIFMTITALIAGAGVLLFLYNIVKFNIIFCAVALLATTAAAAVLVIRYNMGFTSFIALDEENLYMKSWENGFFSYDILNGITIIREFIPSKTEFTSVSVNEIKKILVGTPNYIMRNSEGKKFEGMYQEVYEKADSQEKAKMEKEDIIYISTQKGASCFMPIEHLHAEDVINILIKLDKTDGIEIKCSDRNMNKRIMSSRGIDSKKRKMEIIPDNLIAADIINTVKENEQRKLKPKPKNSSSNTEIKK